MLLALGFAALVVVVGAVVATMVLAGRQAQLEDGPKSEPSDFVAPGSSGGYRFRGVDETADQFHARVAEENRAAPRDG